MKKYFNFINYTSIEITSRLNSNKYLISVNSNLASKILSVFFLKVNHIPLIIVISSVKSDFNLKVTFLHFTKY